MSVVLESGWYLLSVDRRDEGAVVLRHHIEEYFIACPQVMCAVKVVRTIEHATLGGALRTAWDEALGRSRAAAEFQTETTGRRCVHGAWYSSDDILEPCVRCRAIKTAHRRCRYKLCRDADAVEQAIVRMIREGAA